MSDAGLIVDNFAGGGGASLGIELALGRGPDFAINHDPEAVAMHRANHPKTRHFCESVWDANPKELCAGRPVDLAWFSPDCKHFSKAKGGRPVSKRIRGLAWVVVRWARAVRPRVIILENVEEFRAWGPVLSDGRPCPDRRGATFRAWCAALERLGYRLEKRELRACDYGAPTIRKRLFVVARCDGQPIRWPDETHGPRADDLPYRTAAECIDWTIPCPSIFERKRPLADATCRRIASGVVRYVVEAQQPFIVTCNHGGSGFRGQSVEEPMRTITASRDAHGVVVPTLIQAGYGERPGQRPRVPGLEKPLGTVVAGGRKHALVAAFLAKHYGGVVGIPLAGPSGTVTAKDHHALVTSSLVKLYGTCRDGQPVTEPMPTVTAGGQHVAEVRAFLLKYYGTAVGQGLREPLHTTTAKARFGLVTVAGEDYQIADIGMRMLTPRELFRAQGFPDSYEIAPELNGRPLTKTAQIRMAGNSVCPPVARAVVAANIAVAETREEAAA